MSLIVVLLILIVVAVLGLGAAQMAMLGEKSTRYDRDRQVAFEAAEAALVDAQFDITGPNSSSKSRVAQFPGYSGQTPANLTPFVIGCGTTTGVNGTQGMCLPNTSGTPLAYTVDFTITPTHSVPFGGFTDRVFASGNTGIQPYAPPRYIIEILPDPHALSSLNAPNNTQQWIYRITAIGFGPTSDTQVVLQMVYRKPG